MNAKIRAKFLKANVVWRIMMVVLLGALSACGGGGGGSGSESSGSAALQSIAVSSASGSLGVGASQPYVAIGTYSDGSTQNISSNVQWASSAPTVASISSAGVATAVTTGSTTITAAMGAVTGNKSLVVKVKTLQSISVTSMARYLEAGSTLQLTATGTYSDGSTYDLTEKADWKTSNSAVATVNAAGFMIAVAAGGVTISATLDEVTGTRKYAIEPTGVTLTGLAVDPATLFVSPDFQPFPNVCATFSNGSNRCPYTNVTWASSNTSVATVSDTQGIKVLSAGVTTLTATSGSISASNKLTATVPVLDSIEVLPATPTIAAGSTLQMTAMGTYSDGSQKNITTLAGLVWTSGTPGAVSINATGLATGVATGSSVLTATASGKTANTTATVPTTALPPPVTVTLYPVNDNTIGSSSLNAATENTVYQYNYGFTSPGIGMGCNLMYGVLTGIQNINCARGLIKFNLASLAGKTIQSATLSLTSSAYGAGFYRDQWYVAASASPWSGSSVTWINYGELVYTASVSNQSPPTYAGQIFNLDQTVTVRNWVSGAYTNNGFALALTQEQLRLCKCDSFDAFEFHSSEDPSGRGPKLLVTYQ